MIIPRVKNYKKQGGSTVIDGLSLRFEGCPFSFDIAAALKMFLPDTVLDNGTDLLFKNVNEDVPEEWYRLTVTGNGITAEFSDKRGAINAAASIAHMVLDGGAELGIIEDHPDYSYRGVMLDLGRGIREPMQDIKDTVIYMAMSKMNYLHLHLMDAESLCYVSEVIPEVKGTDARNGRQYSKAQLKEIVDLCSVFGIEVIPEIEIPSHASSIVKAYPAFACETPDIEDPSPWCVCPGSEGIFDLYGRLIAELCQIFPGEYIHVGGDELEFADIPELNELCHWDICPKCAAFREKMGLKDIREQYYYVMMRAYDAVKACGRTMMMWNDQIDISKDSPIPKDVLIAFWRIAAPGRGPYEGCTMEGFARQGYKLFNAAYEKTYVCRDEYLREDELKDWTPVSYPEISEEYRDSVIGSEMCAWEYGNRERYGFYDYTLIPNIPMFADRLWRTEPAEYNEDYRRECYKAVFGRRLKTDLSPIFGGFLPPRSRDIITHTESKDIDTDLIAHAIEELSGIDVGGRYSRQRYEYIRLLRDISKLKYLYDRENK